MTLHRISRHLRATITLARRVLLVLRGDYDPRHVQLSLLARANHWPLTRLDRAELKNWERRGR